MGSLIPTDGLTSSCIPCSAALYPDIMLRDKYYAVFDQNIINWITNIIYCSTRDICGTVWSSNTPVILGICLPHEILMESRTRCHGRHFILFIIPPVFEEKEIFPSWVEGRRKRGTERENPGMELDFSSSIALLQHLRAPSTLSAADFTKHMDVALPHQPCH